MTDKTWNLKNLIKKSGSIVTALIAFFIFTSFTIPQDDWKLIRSVKIPPVSKVSSDPYGFVYFSDSVGNVYKYDTNGVQMVMYSPDEKGDITLLEAYRNVNILLFFRNFQQ